MERSLCRLLRLHSLHSLHRPAKQQNQQEQQEQGQEQKQPRQRSASRLGAAAVCASRSARAHPAHPAHPARPRLTRSARWGRRSGVSALLVPSHSPPAPAPPPPTPTPSPLLSRSTGRTRSDAVTAAGRASLRRKPPCSCGRHSTTNVFPSTSSSFFYLSGPSISPCISALSLTNLYSFHPFIITFQIFCLLLPIWFFFSIRYIISIVLMALLDSQQSRCKKHSRDLNSNFHPFLFLSLFYSVTFQHVLYLCFNLTFQRSPL